MIGCPAIQKLHLVGTNSRRIFCWPLDSDRQIFVLPQDSLLVSTICWPSPCWVWVLLKVFSGTIWLPHIIHNYPSTFKNTTKDHTQDMAKINVWPGCKWYQAPWSARLLIIFQFFLQFPRRVVALHQLSKVTRAMCRDVKQALLLMSTLQTQYWGQSGVEDFLLGALQMQQARMTSAPLSLLLLPIKPAPSHQLPCVLAPLALEEGQFPIILFNMS